MKKPQDCTNMRDIREAIDSIDNSIVEFIAKRSEYVNAAAQFKKDETAVRDPQRVENVINSKRELAKKYEVSSILIENIYRMMIDFFINEEMKEWQSKHKDTIHQPPV